MSDRHEDWPPDSLDDGPVRCEDCGTRFVARYRWEPSLPPHNCTQRAERRRLREAARAEARQEEPSTLLPEGDGVVNVQRIHTGRGSYIEPPLKSSWSDLDKLRWHLAVVLHDHNLPSDLVRVEQADHRVDGIRQPDAYNLNGPFGGFGCPSYAHMWGVINGLDLGLRTVNR